jgi:RimJ/RimL family protein N-acetyltransferase
MNLRLEGKKIVLRPVHRSDAASIYANAKDREIGQFTHIPHPYRIQNAYDFIRGVRRWERRKQVVLLGIEAKETGQVIGIINIFHIDRKNRHAEVGYWLGKKYWGRGIMAEALNLMLEHAFRKMKLVRVSAKVFHPNIASARLLEKLGFKLEARLRKISFHRRQWYDDLCYGILKEEFKRRRV